MDELEFPYASTIGSFMCVFMHTHLDLAFAVNILNRFQSNLGKSYLEAIKQVMRYLRRTKSFCLSYQASELELMGYSDSDCQGCVVTRKSTSCYLFLFRGGAIS